MFDSMGPKRGITLPRSKLQRSADAPGASAGPARARTTIRIPKTAEVVAANIRKMIIRGQVKEGDFLQPEAQLMEHFGTSRPTIREAFRILENEQLISVTRGSRSGARIHAPRVASVARYAGFALQAQGTLLSDIYLARLGVEPFAVRLLAEQPQEAKLQELTAELDSVSELLESEGAGRNFRIAVFRLHHSIVSAAGSNTLSLISAMLQSIAEEHMSKFTGGDQPVDGEAVRKHSRAGLRSFRKLLALVSAKDIEAAEAHWRIHIENANKTWLAGYDQTTLVDVLD